MMLRLYSIPYSPWSEKARWALDAQAIPYITVPYMPVVGEPALRLRLRRLRGRVTVPVLVHNGKPVGDSFDIARFGSRRSLTPLVPGEHLAEIERWNGISERMLAAGRLRTTARMLSDGEAMREYVPGSVRKLRRVGGVVGRTGARRLLRKYGDEVGDADLVQVQRDGLLALREGLAAARGDHLVAGRFTYADITMAVGLQFVAPVSERWVRLGVPARPHWSEPELAQEFEDLLAWRDRMYEAFRARTPAEALRAAEPVRASP
jgi:glutathione S-transferase